MNRKIKQSLKFTCVTFIVSRLKSIIIAHSLFQADPINRLQFKPVEMDIVQGVIKIIDNKIFRTFN
jgi:hypothetical protein